MGLFDRGGDARARELRAPAEYGLQAAGFKSPPFFAPAASTKRFSARRTHRPRAAHEGQPGAGGWKWMGGRPNYPTMKKSLSVATDPSAMVYVKV